jgi:SulP family sulfate permease
LRVTGWANIASALLGGMVAYVSFARTSMNHQLGVRDRSVGVAVGLGAIAAMLVGPWRLINFVPLFAPAGLLMALGGGVAYRWLIRPHRGQSRGDYVTIWAIVLSVVFLGFVPGIIVGLAVGCITFVVRYGRVDVVEHRWSGTVIRSSLQRSQRESEVLAEHGNRVRIFRLRGFVFFGIADRLYRELLACAAETDGVIWIVVDFGGVTGMDSSAAAAFVKFARNIDADRGALHDLRNVAARPDALGRLARRAPSPRSPSTIAISRSNFVKRSCCRFMIRLRKCRQVSMHGWRRGSARPLRN